MQMKIDQINGRNKNFDISIELDENDLQEAYEIALMMDMPGWNKLMKHVEVIREQICENGKATVKYNDRLDLSQTVWSVLQGFDACAGIAQGVIDRAEAFRQKRKGEIEGVSHEDL